MLPEQKLRELGIVLEAAPLHTGKFVQATRAGNLVFTSGQVPVWGDVIVKGRVGQEVSVDDGYEAARLCTLNCLRAIKAVIGSLDEVAQVMKVLGMVNVAPGFDDTPSVINGCSDLLHEIFGERGHHARSAVGMTIPLNFAVEIEMVVQTQSAS